MTDPADLGFITRSYRNAGNRVLFLDYDGTLAPLIDIPEESRPEKEVRNIIVELASDPGNRVYIISGRERHFLSIQFRGTAAGLVAEHGLWMKEKSGRWIRSADHDGNWKKTVLKWLLTFSSAYTNTFIENKENSVAYHYRTALAPFGEPERELFRKQFSAVQRDYPGLELLEGNHIMEIKPGGYNKGTAASKILSSGHFDFILAAGDDLTDERLFESLPAGSCSIRIGPGKTAARYRVDSQAEFITFMKHLIRENGSRPFTVPG